MCNTSALRFLFIALLAFNVFAIHAQQKVLTLKDALNTALSNYGTIRAKGNYLKASRAGLVGTRREYLPDLTLSAQQNYGTINGQSGPLYGFRGLSASSGGPPMESQTWHSAFGALYLANISWDFFSFGRVREKRNLAKSAVMRDEDDLEQEKFQHQVRVATAYLNLLAAQRLTRSQQNNLERAEAFRAVVMTRTKNGLNAGVDSSLANAELSSARIALLRVRDTEMEQANILSQLLGVVQQDFMLDSIFFTRIPSSINDSVKPALQSHPVLKFYKTLVQVSEVQEKYFHKFNYPTFSLFTVLQERGSGFQYNYGEQYPKAYSGNYWKGVRPARANYLAGIGLIWNLTSPLRIQQEVASQKFVSLALRDQYELVEKQLNNQLQLSEARINNAMQSYREVPVQIKAATDAYQQKTVLYRNGLTTIVEVTQALSALNRAETDRDIAYSNVWQALLLKAAATGEIGLFINEF